MLWNAEKAAAQKLLKGPEGLSIDEAVKLFSLESGKAQALGEMENARRILRNLGAYSVHPQGRTDGKRAYRLVTDMTLQELEELKKEASTTAKQCKQKIRKIKRLEAQISEIQRNKQKTLIPPRMFREQGMEGIERDAATAQM